MQPDLSHGTVGAIVWDYDGTIVDTREKNLRVTRKIVEKIAHADPDVFPALRSLDAYTSELARSVNWREFYKREFGFSEALVDQAGKAWSAFQLDDSTPAPVFEGIHAVLSELRSFRHGIVSQNSRDAIARVLDGNDIQRYFSAIIGYEEVDLRRQKPAPDGLLKCIDKVITDSTGLVIYIGDHETDAECARNANTVLARTRPGIHVTSVGAAYSSIISVADWSSRPDYEARSVHDIVAIVKSISPWRLTESSANTLNPSPSPEV